MGAFQYLEPNSLAHAIRLMEQYGDEALVTAGNTDLLVNIRKGVKAPKYLIGLGGIPDLAYVKQDETGSLRLGATTTLRTIERSSLVKQSWPVIAESAGKVGSVQIRNLATLGGNLCNASPAADTAPTLVALGAQAWLVSGEGQRTVPLEEFFLGPGRSCLRPAELLVEVVVLRVPARTGCVYLKHALRLGPDCSLVGVAAMVRLEEGSDVCQDARLVLGAVAPTPIRARKAECLLIGQQIGKELRTEAALAAQGEASPISDVRASVEYRLQMVGLLVRRALEEAVTRAGTS